MPNVGMAARTFPGAAPFPNVNLDDDLPSREAMLVAKALAYPLRRVVLLAVN